MIGKGLVLFYGFLLCNLCLYSQSTISSDSLERKLQTEKLSDRDRAEVLNELSWMYAETNPIKAQEVAMKALAIAEKEGTSEQLVIAYHRLGTALYNRNKLDSAIIYLNRAVELAGTNQELLGGIYQQIGNLEADRGNYEASMKMYHSALSIFEKQNDIDKVANAYSSIGALYINLRNFEKMYEYTSKALEYHRKSANKLGISVDLANLAEYYFQKSDTNKVYQALIESRRLLHEMNMVTNEANVLSSLGDYYSVFFNNQGKAIEIYKEALSLLKEGDNNNLRMDFYRKIAFSYYQIPDYKNALLSMQRLMEITDTSNVEYMRINYYYLAYIYIGLKDADNATKSLDKYVELSDLVYAETQKKSIAELDVKYQTEKKELKIVSLEKERKFIILLSVLGGILLITIIILIAARQKVITQKRKIAEQKVAQLEQEKQLIATKSLLEGETTERARLSKDLHDGLGGLLSVTKHKMANMKGSLTIPEEQVETFNSALEMLDNSIKELRRVAHNLMPESLMRYGLSAAIKDFCESIDKATYHYYGVEKRIDEKLEVAAFRIVSELVNNALKHANANKINVQLVQEQDRISLTVYDDGCGFDLKSIDKTKSVGLNSIEQRVVSFNGRIDILSEPGKGTEITVEFKC